MDTNDLPDSWPPPGDTSTKILPIFPLPNVWLFPGAVVPLQVFEPRYIQLIEDCLDGPGRFVLGTIDEGHETEQLDAPPFAPVAGFGEIGRHDRMPDGRYQIVLIGLGRVRIEEVDSDRQYRKVRAQGLIETGAGGEDEPNLRRQLTRAIQVRTSKAMPGQAIPAIPADVPIGRLADLLSLRMPLPHSSLTEIFNEIDVTARAHMVLEEDKLRPLLPPSVQPGQEPGNQPPAAGPEVPGE
ncbi:MAG: Lon protease-like protein [Planctomycetota bacterium]|jgi:Lon protease-like protein